MSPRARTILWLAACCAATFALKVWSHGTRLTPGHGDTPYYFHVAQNLFDGRGFVCDYVWSYLENPSGAVPAPSHGWWMPGPSVVSLVGMWIAGAATYGASMVAMAALTSLFPVVAWWTAWKIARDRSLAARAALLAVAFHPFVDKPAATLSHGPYGVFAGFALLFLVGARLTVARGAVLGLLLGLAHYFRSDALTIFGTAGVVTLFAWRRVGWRGVVLPLTTAVATYVVVMAPWFVRNVQVFGAPLPPGPSKALYLRDYSDWFALPDRLNAKEYLRDGWGPVLEEKWEQTTGAAWSYFASYFDPMFPENPGDDHSVAGMAGAAIDWWSDTSQTDFEPGRAKPWTFMHPLSIGMSALTAFGLARLVWTWWRARRAAGAEPGPSWVGVYGLHSAAEIVFYAWIFTGVAAESYVTSLYSLYPLFVVAMAAALGLPASLAAKSVGAAKSWAWASVIVLTFLNGIGVAAFLRAYKGPEYVRADMILRDTGHRLVRAGFDPRTDRVMVRTVWDFHSSTELPCVRLPDEGVRRTIATAQRLGAKWLLLDDVPEGLSLGSRQYRLQIYARAKDPSCFALVDRNEHFRTNIYKILPKAFEVFGVAEPPKDR